MKLKSNKTYILPTRYGLIFLPIILIEFIVSITFGHPFAYFITFSSISMIILSAFYTNGALDDVSIGFIENDLVESNKRSKIQFNLNLKENFIKKEIVVESSESSLKDKQTISFGKSFISTRVEYPKRGIYQIDRIKLSTTFPFGLFYSWKYVDINKSMFVYPKISSSSEVHLTKYMDETEYNSLNKVGTNKDEFFEHKKAQDGDSWKQIDWKAYSRGMGLLTKTYTENQSLGYFFSIDLNTNEKELEQITNSLFHCYKRSIQTSLSICDDFVSKGLDYKHLSTCLRSISAFSIIENNNV